MLYPFKLDFARGRVLQIGMDEASFLAASFLDERILTPATRGAWTPVRAFLDSAAAAAGTRLPLHFIFHTGHVGSTLVSRLLDETGSVLPLREPLPLRTLADARDAVSGAMPGAPPCSREEWNRLLEAFLCLWRRGFAKTGAVIIKATSSAARLAPALLAAAPDTQAVYLNLRAEPWLATLLAGENSPIDLRGHAPERLRRLAAQGFTRLPAIERLSPGELAALSWLAETTTQQGILSGYPGRVRALDFEEFLADVPGHLQAILGHFGLRAEPAFLARVVQSPVLTRYSKAPEHPYDPALRAAVLQDSRRRHRDEILRGLRLLETLRAAG